MHGLFSRVAVAGLAWALVIGGPTAPARADQAHVALIEIHEAPLEQPGPLAWLFGSGEQPTMRELVDQFRDVAADEDFRALVVRLRGAELKATQAEEIGAAMEIVREAGKKVALFSDSYETTEFVLASYADEVILQSGGAVSLPGMYMEEMYLADTLAWLGLTPQLVQIGDYKGANEALMRSAPSPQWEQNISRLLDGIYGNVRARVKAGRHMTDEKLDDAMTKAWMATGDTAKAIGLVDTLLDLPDLSEHLERTLGADQIIWTDYQEKSGKPAMDTSNPFALFSKMMREPEVKAKRSSIAVLHVDGPIIDGESEEGGLLGEQSVGSVTIRRALGEIEDDDLIKGLIIRIDSPGGSAIASEVIWQGVKRVAAAKPVWVSIGSMAASGGYYVAVSADRIYVNPSSIVGSIGVVGGKIALGGAYDKLKIHVVGRARGPMGGMFSSATPWTEQQKQLVREKMAETYDLFVRRVKEGRKTIDLAQTAEGRLFTGKDAIGLGMADKVGGMHDAIKDMAAALQLEDRSYDILDFPGPKSLADVLGHAFGRFGVKSPAGSLGVAAGSAAPALAVDAVRSLIGERAWSSLRDNLAAMMQLRKEPVLLTSPRAVIVK